MEVHHLDSDGTDRPGTSRSRRIWLILEGPDVIELKEAMLDRDAEEAAEFFRHVVAPRVLLAAQERGIAVEEKDDGCLSG